VILKVEDPLLINQFENVKHEITHLAKLGDFEINPKKLSENSSSLNFELTEACFVSMNFEVN